MDGLVHSGKGVFVLLLYPDRLLNVEGEREELLVGVLDVAVEPIHVGLVQVVEDVVLGGGGHPLNVVNLLVVEL